MQTVTLRGINNRGKARVSQHGPTFAVMDRENNPGGLDRVLVRCIRPGCGCDSCGTAWLGWLTFGREVERP